MSGGKINTENTFWRIKCISFVEAGFKFMTDEFKLCFPLNSSNIMDFKNWLSETWFDLAMIDYPYPANFLQPLPAWPVKVSHISIKYHIRQIFFHLMSL